MLQIVSGPSHLPVDVEPEVLEHGAEQHAVFVAVTASFSADELGLHGLEVDVDAATKDDVEVLEWDRCDVGTLECRQRRFGCFARSGVADPREIGVEVEALNLPFGTTDRKS